MLPQKRPHDDIISTENETGSSNSHNQATSRQFSHEGHSSQVFQPQNASIPSLSQLSQQNHFSPSWMPQNEDQHISTSYPDPGETVSMDWSVLDSNFFLDQEIPDQRGPTLVCFGMIYDVRAKLEGDMSALGAIIESVGNAQSEFCFHGISTSNGSFRLQFDGSKTVSAVLNEETSPGLLTIAELESVEFRAYWSIKNLVQSLKGSKNKKKVCIMVNINVIGDQNFTTTVGHRLNAAQLFLQHPDVIEENLGYENPHLVVFPGLKPRTEASSRSRSELPELSMLNSFRQSEKIEVQNEIAVVLNSLTRSRFLKTVDADSRIKTPLLQHQKEALDFMAQREFGPVPVAYSLWQEATNAETGESCFEHIITGAKRQFIPSETGGGIFADVMGMGKTLTLLSTIIRTSQRAIDFWKMHTPKNEPQLFPARATLVIAPSESVIDVWTKEIHKHIYGGLTVCVYHGRGRETNPEILAKADIVLTTYNTVSVEGLKPESALFRIHWFRIVLDEAHKIRTISTKLYKTASRLGSQIRWCMTGTPVQNSLEDLGALVSFLRIPILEAPSEFKKHIIDPILKRTGIGSEALRMLLDSICLRRSDTLLDLPGVDDKYCLLNFTDAERAQYGAAEFEMSQKIKQQANLEERKKGYFGIFQLEMRLRRLCNHGTYEHPFAESQDDDMQIEPSTALASIKNAASTCEECQLDLANELCVNGLFSGNYTSCGHLLCSKCFTGYERKLLMSKNRCCPICQKNFEGYEAGRKSRSSKKAESIFNYFRSTGHSTKVQSLLEDVKKLPSDEKCIIFSEWTKSLDLIGHVFTEQDIPFLRIDGSYSNAERSKILDEFRKVPSMQILMMTTGTGAEGLNLAIANRVYIFEPQWNPMVESQAIARVARLGQKKSVKVVRYIIAGTVEEMMRSQQTMKIALADAGWESENRVALTPVDGI